ncbi:MAG: mechanosensitive ion channel [Akkermansiaceae bacterium]
MNNTMMFLGNTFRDTMQDWINTVQDLFSSLGRFGDILLLILILWVGKFIVKGVGKLVEKSLSKTSIDDKIAARFGHDTNVTGGIVGFVKALLMLFILIFALGVAKLDVVSQPLNDMLTKVTNFIPNLVVAGVLAYVIVLIAGLVKKLLADVLVATKLDERLGSVAGTTPVSNSLVTAVYAFILLLCAPAVLDLLKIDAISSPIKGIVTSITDAVPRILAAGVIIFLGCLIGNIAKRLVSNLLEGTNVNTFPAKMGLSVPTTGARSISSVAGTVVMISVVVLSLTAAIRELNIDILSRASEGLYTGYFNVLLALIILAAGIIASRFVYDNLVGGNPLLAKISKYAIIIFTSVVAINRTGIANGLASLPYTVAICAAGVALGIGGAIAIGLGGHTYVSRWLDKRSQP